MIKNYLSGLLLSGLILFVLSASVSMAESHQSRLFEEAKSYADKINLKLNNELIVVSVKTQVLYHRTADGLIEGYPVSTSKFGVGAVRNTNKTPTGFHTIKQKIGDGLPKGMILKGRVPTGNIAEIITETRNVKEDHVTTRILWLDGLEKGVNKSGNVDSYSRYIYIHGTHEEGLIGTPQSHGCVRMLNDDVIKLFNSTPEGTQVYITKN